MKFIGILFLLIHLGVSTALAAKSCNEFLSLDSSEQYRRGERLLEQGQDSEALFYFSSILIQNPNHKSALGRLIRINLNLGDLEQAKKYLDQKLSLDPEDTYAHAYAVEYYYKSDNLKAALKFANRLVSSNAPKKSQLRVPMAYRIGLALRAKVLASMRGKSSEALTDIENLEKYLNEPLGWVTLLKAEIYFKEREISKSLKLIKNSLQTMNQIDLNFVAALIRIENEGERIESDSLLSEIFKVLSDAEVSETMRLSKVINWDYLPAPMPNTREYSINNSFWTSVYNTPVNSQASSKLTKSTD